jgi:septal ring factor EnvC (AmiA/AmiB activator)
VLQYFCFSCFAPVTAFAVFTWLIFAILQRLTSLVLFAARCSGDLIQKSREFDQQNLELKDSVRRLHASEESNSNSETKDSLSVEILKFRSELYSTQQQLRQRDEELSKTKELLKECELALKSAEASKNLMIPELHNARAKLLSAELDFENSRGHNAELDRSR